MRKPYFWIPEDGIARTAMVDAAVVSYPDIGGACPVCWVQLMSIERIGQTFKHGAPGGNVEHHLPGLMARVDGLALEIVGADGVVIERHAGEVVA